MPHNSRLGCYHGAVINFSMVSYSCLASNDYKIPDLCAPADRHLGHKNGIFSDLHVVAYLYMIIDLCTLPDEGIPRCRPVDGSICPYLHVISDDDTANLRYLVMSAAFQYVPETV